MAGFIRETGHKHRPSIGWIALFIAGKTEESGEVAGRAWNSRDYTICLQEIRKCRAALLPTTCHGDADS